MGQKEALQLFNDRQIRTAWDDKEEKWYFSIVDVVAVLTESPVPRKYWSVLKSRIKKESAELTTICSQLKMTSANALGLTAPDDAPQIDSGDAEEQLA